jgi:hypothetical protein
VSYSFYVPALAPDGSQQGHCTIEDFRDHAHEVLAGYLNKMADGEQKTATAVAAHRAIDAALAMAASGVVGDRFRVSIAGHANPEPGSPPEGWGNDSCSIGLSAVAAR